MSSRSVRHTPAASRPPDSRSTTSRSAGVSSSVASASFALFTELIACPAARSQGWTSGSIAPTRSTPAWRRRTNPERDTVRLSLGRARAARRRLLRLDFGQAPVESIPQLVGVVLVVRPALARDHDAGGRDAREASEADELPGHTHGCVGYGR